MRVAIALAGAVFAAAATAQTADRTACDGRNPRAAIAACTALIARGEDLAAALRNRGRAHVNRGESDAGIADLDRALGLNPRDVAALTARGGAWLGKRVPDRAMADFDAALALEPDHAAALLYRARARNLAGRPEEALGDYRRAVAIDPDNAQAWSSLGLLLARRSDLDGAIAAFGRAIAIAPSFARAYHDRADAWRAKGEWRRALADYDRALALNAGATVTLLGRGLASADAGRNDDAARDMAAVLAREPANRIAAGWLAAHGRSPRAE